MWRQQLVRFVIFPVINVVKPTSSLFAGRSIFFDEENYTCITKMLAQRSLPEISREMGRNELACWFSFNVRELWLTRGGWHGHHPFTVEPSNAH